MILICFVLLSNPQHLEQSLVHNKCSINLCWINTDLPDSVWPSIALGIPSEACPPRPLRWGRRKPSTAPSLSKPLTLTTYQALCQAPHRRRAGLNTEYRFEFYIRIITIFECKYVPRNTWEMLILEENCLSGTLGTRSCIFICWMWQAYLTHCFISLSWGWEAAAQCLLGAGKKDIRRDL